MRPPRDHRPRPDRRRGHRRRSSSAPIAGDVVTIGVDGSGELVARLLEQQPFVREAGDVDGVVRLYVDDGEASLPLVLRLLDGAGLAPQALALHRPSLDDVFLRQTGRSLRDEAA